MYNWAFQKDRDISNNPIVQLGLDFKLLTKIGLDTTTTTHHKLLGHFKAYLEAEIWYADFTHKYKIIQGITTKLNPIPQGGDVNLTSLFKGF